MTLHLVSIRKCRAAIVGTLLIVSGAPARAAWIVDGSPICTDPSQQRYATLTSDGANGAFIFWEDDRGADVYGQHVDSNGTRQWAPNGMPITSGENAQGAPGAIPDGAGGAILHWTDYSGGSDLYAQRINPNGLPQWGASGIPICTAAPQSWCEMVPDRLVVASQPHGVIMAWGDSRDSYQDIYVQHVNPDGGGLWKVDGVLLCGAVDNQDDPVLAMDGAEGSAGQQGAIVAWQDSRNGGWQNFDIYARRIDAGGTPLWANDGVPVCTVIGRQYDPKIVSVGADVVISWIDFERSGLFAQKLDVNGNPLWAANGVAVYSGESVISHGIVADGIGGVILVWESSNAGNSDIYGQRLDGSGTRRWGTSGRPIATASYAQSDPQIVPTYIGAIVAWTDRRTGTGSAIYAQRITWGGQLLWTPGGVHLSTDYYGGLSKCVASGSDKAIVTWLDSRDENADIYASRVLNPTSVDASAHFDGGLRIVLRSSNPALGAVALDLQLSRASTVLAEVFDSRGRKVRSIAGPKLFSPGNHLLTWDGRDEHRHAVTPGVYFLRARADDQSRVVKLVQLR
jgi:hypothetical protein